MVEFVSIDFEKAYDSSESICSVGVATVEDGKVTVEGCPIRPPEQRLGWWQTKQGWSTELFADAPAFPEVWENFIWPRIRGRLLVAHNACGVDIAMLRAAFRHYDAMMPELNYVCSLAISRKIWPLESHGLLTVTEHLGIPLDHHNPKSDANAVARLVFKACQEKQVLGLHELSQHLGIAIRRASGDDGWEPGKSRNVGGLLSREPLELDIPDGYEASTHPFYGKNVVITGSLQHCTNKNQAYRLVERLGGQPDVLNKGKPGVNKHTNYLVSGNKEMLKLADGNPTEKQKKALRIKEQGRDICLLSEEEFLDLLHASIDAFRRNSQESLSMPKSLRSR